MIHTQNHKVVPIIFPAAIVDNDDPVGAYGDANPVSVDTLDWDYASVYLVIGATDFAITEYALYHGDVAASGADDTDFTLVPGTDYNVSGTLPSATDDNSVFAHHVDMRPLGRYLALGVKVGDGTTGAYLYAEAVLTRPRIAPNTAAERGLAAELFYPA